MSLKVLHLSPTPLVAAPGRLARTLRGAGIDALCAVLKDYPADGPLAGKFIDDSVVLEDACPEVRALVDDFAAEADVIHVHNDLPPGSVKWLRERSPKAAFVYQVHSPLREGPLYYGRADHIGLPFRAHLAVGQYQPRHYPDYLPVPNLVPDKPVVNPRQAGERLRVLFSPSHTRGGRWNAKYSEPLEKAIQALRSSGQIEVVWPSKPVTPGVLMALRRTCHVTIDEIVTGAFHQVSIEGLCAGNVVINRADFFSKAMMAQCAQCDELPPFVHADGTTIQDVLLHLAGDAAQTAQLQIASHRYFTRHLAAEALVRRFISIYETLH